MESLTSQGIEEIKQHRWFIMHNRDRCTICGKEFDFQDNSYFGHLDNGSYAYTCEVCSKKLQDAKKYTNSQKKGCRIPAPSAKLWRYMDLAKFLSLLETNSLFFTRLDHFVDPYEGALGIKANEEAWSVKEMTWRKRWIEAEMKSDNNKIISSIELENIASQKFREYRDNIRRCRKMNYLTCWHQSDNESEAMWQLYTKDTQQGIAIQTTFERLYQSLPAVLHTEFGMVNYVDYKEYNNGISPNKFHPFEAPWYKRKSFEHEKEFRVIIVDDSGDMNKTVRIDINQLIENVYISPQAERWFAELIHDIVRHRYKLWLNVCQSDLNIPPFY